MKNSSMAASWQPQTFWTMLLKEISSDLFACNPSSCGDLSEKSIPATGVIAIQKISKFSW